MAKIWQGVDDDWSVEVLCQRLVYRYDLIVKNTYAIVSSWPAKRRWIDVRDNLKCAKHKLGAYRDICMNNIKYRWRGVTNVQTTIVVNHYRSLCQVFSTLFFLRFVIKQATENELNLLRNRKPTCYHILTDKKCSFFHIFFLGKKFVEKIIT